MPVVAAPGSASTAPAPVRASVEVVLGFSLFLALASISAWGLITLGSMSQPVEEQTMLYSSMRSLGFLGTLFLFGFGCAHLTPLFRINTAAASTALWIVGYTGMFALVFTENMNLPLFVLVSVCLGMAHALSFVVWQRVFFDKADALARRQIAVASALGSVVYLFVSLIADIRVYAVVIALLICANALLLRRCAAGLFPRYEPGTRLVVTVGGSGEMGHLMASSWRYAVCIAAVGCVNGISSTLVRQGEGSPLALNVMLAVGMLVACVLLLLLWEGLHLSFSFKAAYTAVFLGMATGFLVLPFAGPAYRFVFAGVANLAFTVVSMFMMITCLRLARLRNMDPIAVFGVFAGIVYSGVAVGRIVGYAFGGWSDVSQLLVVALLSVYVLSFSSVLFNAAKATPKGETFDPIRDEPAAAETDEPAAPRAVAGTDAADGADAVPGTCGPCAAPATAGANRSKAASAAGPVDAGVPAGDGDMVAPGGPEAKYLRRVVVLQDAVPACCQEIRRAYGLSNREADVLELIVRGRDVAHMAEALFVSENTVRSHCKSLYKKLGVHSRQQVFDLVESVKAADDPIQP